MFDWTELFFFLNKNYNYRPPVLQHVDFQLFEY